MFTLLLALATTPAHAGDSAATYTAVCASCHGPAGAGDGPVAAALTPKPASFADAAFWADKKDEDIAKAIKEGGAAVGKSPLMAPFGSSMTDEQIKEMVAYLKTLKKE